MNQQCIICRKPLENGIIIYGKGICESCESRLLKIDNSTDFYEFYKLCIRRNLVQLMPTIINNKCQDYL